MTDPQARLWLIERRAELARLIDRQNTVDALAKMHRDAGHEFDTGLWAHHARRLQDVRVRA